VTRSAQVAGDTVLRRVEHIVFSRLDDELLAIDTQGGYVYSLNVSAGRVWDEIQAPIAVNDLCSRLMGDYAVDESTCRRDVVAVLQGLCDAGLVDICNGATDSGR
jgi:hypothetical protein